MPLISELRRRNVFRAAVAYTVVWWLLVQVAGLLLDAFDAPGWIFRTLIILLAVGFPLALVLSWFFELTPEGLVKTEDLIAETGSGNPVNQYLTPIVISMLSAAVILFALDKYVWTDKPLLEGPAATDSSLEQLKSLAVLPFSNHGNQAEAAYFVDGIHDDLLTMLARLGSFNVVSRTSVMRYRGSDHNILEISDELGVDYVLEGGVQRFGDQVRINAQLIDGNKDQHLWAETFDRELTSQNLFAIQSNIARAIASALDARLSNADESLLAAIPTESLEAYDAYMLGRQALLTDNGEAYEEALEHFEFAVSLDDSFAEAYAGICQAQLHWYFKSSDTEHYERARSACNQALGIDADQAEVHIALGTLLRYNGDYQGAEREQRQALSTEPQNVDARKELGLVLALQGKLREAERELKKAETLQPDHWPVHDALFDFYRIHDDQPDRFERAVKSAMRLVELNPDGPAAWNNLGIAYVSLEQYDAAKAAWDRALELEPTRAAYTNRGLDYYYEGRFADAVEMQQKAIELEPNDHRSWGRLAESYRLLGGQEARTREAYATAIIHAEAMLEVNPQDWRTSGLLAIYYVHSGQPEAADSLIESALALSNRDPEALLYAALIAYERGETEATLTTLAEMIERNPAFRIYAAQDPDLKALEGNARFDALMASE